MKTAQARTLGQHIAALIEQNRLSAAKDLLTPVLARRTPFAMLRHIGEAIGKKNLQSIHLFLDDMAADRTVGGWVVIASALEQQLDTDLTNAFRLCRDYLILADVWHATDALGEGVPGWALIRCFKPAVSQLKTWRRDSNAQVRRAVGTAVHYWAKRSKGASQLRFQAVKLLDLLAPMFGESDMDAVKGIGWGLKTMGRHYPDLLADWLVQQTATGPSHFRALMLRKAITYLPADQQGRIQKHMLR